MLKFYHYLAKKLKKLPTLPTAHVCKMNAKNVLFLFRISQRYNKIIPQNLGSNSSG